MERLDEVERGLKKLGMEEAVVEEEEEEEDVGVTARDRDRVRESAEASKGDLLDRDLGDMEPERPEASASAPGSAPIGSGYLSDDESERGYSQEIRPSQAGVPGRGTHGRAASDRGGRRSVDWVPSREGQELRTKKRTVVVERLETIDPTPFFSCW